jgi:hypothetical protein
MTNPADLVDVKVGPIFPLKLNSKQSSDLQVSVATSTRPSGHPPKTVLFYIQIIVILNINIYTK